MRAAGENHRQVTDERFKKALRTVKGFKWAMQDSNLRHLPCKKP
jgi:hypothetical protein